MNRILLVLLFLSAFSARSEDCGLSTCTPSPTVTTTPTFTPVPTMAVIGTKDATSQVLKLCAVSVPAWQKLLIAGFPYSSVLLTTPSTMSVTIDNSTKYTVALNFVKLGYVSTDVKVAPMTKASYKISEFTTLEYLIQRDCVNITYAWLK